MSAEDWGYYEGRLLALRRVAADRRERVDATLLLLNSSGEDREFRLPPPLLGWRQLLDTAQPEAGEREHAEDVISVAAHALILLAVRDPKVPE